MSAFITRIRFDAFGNSAGDISDGLLGAAENVGSLAGVAGEASYGETVIERCLAEEDGSDYSWKGRLSVYPAIGCEPFVPVSRLRSDS